MSIITVGISDLAVGQPPDVIVTYALGSCVGISLYDESLKIGGLAHIMLPSSKEIRSDDQSKMKFADTGILMLMKKLENNGANYRNLRAKIAGGAQMFASNNTFNIGERNIKAVKQVLDYYKIPIIAEQVGGKMGRTVYFHIDSGILEVKSATQPTIVI